MYHQFPNAKFILFTRNTNEWFQSLLRHSKGKIWEDFKLHCKLYRREKDYYQKLDANNKEQEYFSLAQAKHYKNYYETRNREVIDFFKENNGNQLIICDLNNSKKWQKVGEFFNINIPENFEMHSNKSGKKKIAFIENMLK